MRWISGWTTGGIAFVIVWLSNAFHGDKPDTVDFMFVVGAFFFGMLESTIDEMKSSIKELSEKIGELVDKET